MAPARVPVKAADIEGLPLVAEEELYPRADSWVVRLRALRDYVEYSARNFMLAHGIENPDRPDKGGSSNLYKYLYGTPQWKLATDGRFVFEMFKPGQAKGTEGGEFHLFLQDILEFATGEDPEEDSKLLPWLKTVPKTYRQMDELVKEELALINEEGELRSQELGPQEYDRRRADIAQRQLAIAKKKYDVWAELFPYTYGSRKAG